MNEIPRRAYLDRLIPAERSIYDAIQLVEALGADVRLTDVVVRLGEAKDKLADYVDDTNGPAPTGYMHGE